MREVKDVLFNTLQERQRTVRSEDTERQLCISGLAHDNICRGNFENKYNNNEGPSLRIYVVQLLFYFPLKNKKKTTSA